MASRDPPATPAAIPTVIAGKLSSVCKTSALEVSWSVITGVLREDVEVVGDSLALVVTVTKSDDICPAVEI